MIQINQSFEQQKEANIFKTQLQSGKVLNIMKNTDWLYTQKSSYMPCYGLKLILCLSLKF